MEMMRLQVGILLISAFLAVVECQNRAGFFPSALSDQPAPLTTDQKPVAPPAPPADQPAAPQPKPDPAQLTPGQAPPNPPTVDQAPVPPNGAFQPPFPAQGSQQPFQPQFSGRYPQGFYPYNQQPGQIPNFQTAFQADPFQQNPFPYQQSVLPQNNPFLQNQAQDSAQFAKLLYCQVANGTMPDWTDATCQKYWSCLNFNLSLESCPTDKAYDYSKRECGAAAGVKCQEQNLNFWQLLQATVRGAPQPIPSFTPLSSLPGGRQSVSLDNDVCTKLGSNLPRLESVTNSALLNLSNCPFNNCNMTLITFVCP